MTIKGLWPDDLKADAKKSTPQENTPQDILSVQAKDLGIKTNRLLEGRIERGSQGEWITLDFYITGPSLDNYSYHLLKVRHKLPTYPLELIESRPKGPVRIPISSRGMFEGRLRFIFASPLVRKIVQDLLTYARRGTKSAAG